MYTINCYGQSKSNGIIMTKPVSYALIYLSYNYSIGCQFSISCQAGLKLN